VRHAGEDSSGMTQGIMLCVRIADSSPYPRDVVEIDGGKSPTPTMGINGRVPQGGPAMGVAEVTI
jgi:hypothetical protein